MWMQSQFINVFREISHEEEKVEEMIPEYFQPHYQRPDTYECNKRKL